MSCNTVYRVNGAGFPLHTLTEDTIISLLQQSQNEDRKERREAKVHIDALKELLPETLGHSLQAWLDSYHPNDENIHILLNEMVRRDNDPEGMLNRLTEDKRLLVDGISLFQPSNAIIPR